MPTPTRQNIFLLKKKIFLLITSKNFLAVGDTFFMVEGKAR
jgi:hypothetical protein